VLFLPAIIISISAMMAAFGRNIAAMNALRATRDQMATMAVERERSRVARDLHDILGHSLTVITVKTELAGRLIDVDPARARTRSAKWRLARGARRCAPPSPAIAASRSPASSPRHGRRWMPRASRPSCPPRPRTSPPSAANWPAGSCARVTNVIRHAQASRCRVRLTARSVSVEDDGVGPASGAGTAGSGLIGLRERVEARRRATDARAQRLGGFLLKVDAVIRLLIADDQALVRGALSALLGLEPDIEVVAEVGRGDEVVDAAVRAADVALLDIEMPGWTGSRRHPRCAAPCRPAGAHRPRSGDPGI
jgi:two-component system sensor histidine kinase DesK